MTTIHKFISVGDWEGLYVDGGLVKENHQGRVDVVDYIEEGMEIEKVVSTRVNLPEGDHSYPSDLQDVIEDDRYDYNE